MKHLLLLNMLRSRDNVLFTDPCTGGSINVPSHG
jgi:hypothetical protein